jgi:branched-chain amino acid aminotransferase
MVRKTADKRRVWLNGELIPWRNATVPLLSHGFSRGSAIFEAFGIHQAPAGPMAFRMDEHLKRLKQSADLLGMEMRYGADEIAAAVAQVVRANRLGRGIAKIMAYWGEEAVIRLVLRSKLDVAVFAIRDTGELHLDDTTPISACLASWRKLHPETVPVAAKACANYLNAYLARRDAQDRGFDVGVLLGTDGFLAEGSTESVFLVKDGVLKTPPLGRILSSISRMSILEVARSINIPVEETALRADALFGADEIFTSHTGVKVHPVNRFEGRALDAPGPVTGKLLKAMDDILHFRNHQFRRFFQPLA